MTCEPCALRQAGDNDRADAIVAIGTQRIVLAMLNGSDDAVGAISAEFKGCVDCAARIAAMALGMCVQALAHMAGSADAAAQWIAHGLAKDLDQLGGADFPGQ